MGIIRSDVDLSPAIRTLSRQLSFWAVLSIASGVYLLFASDLVESAFPISLVLLGIATLYVRAPAMLPLFAVAYLWSAATNVLGFTPGLLFLAVFQTVAGIVIFRQFRVCSHIQERHVIDYSRIESPSLRLIPATHKFPLASALLGAAGLLELVLVTTTVLTVAIASLDKSLEEAVDAGISYLFLGYLFEPLIVFAFAFGLSSRLTGLQPRRLATAGMLLGGLLMVTFLTLAAIGSFLPSVP